MFKTKRDKLEEELLKEELENSEIQENEDVIENENFEESEDKSANENAEVQANYYKDQLLRKAAEFENYKKRTETEISNVYRYANEALIKELLPVLDDFNRVKKSWDEKHDLETLKKGFELVYDKFAAVLKKQGLKEIEATGKQFDVNLHEALMQVPDKNAEPNTVTNVAENGYFLKDKVLRHAKVIVSTKENDNK